jgi:AcrR family transcriptional regulator
MRGSTRERLLWATVRCVAERGYEAVTISDLVEGAKISRSTFYEQFDSKEECVLAAYDLTVDYIVGRVFEAYESGGDESWPDGVRSGLDTFLNMLASEPEIARMATLELPTAGPKAHERYRAAVERFLPFLAAGREFSDRGEELPQHVDLMAIGGAEAIIFDEVVAGRTEQLPQMLPSILFTMLVPYLGPEDAAQQMHAAAGVS